MATRAEYFEQYSNWAMEQMLRYGIPASIVLAQGAIESGNGDSRLSHLGNNHFGIKATDSWISKGGKYGLHRDDKPNEKFCYYDSVAESYEHHSIFLCENSRYNICFAQAPDDYKAWAQGLQYAGYATSKNYAETLIWNIKEFDLADYDQKVMAACKKYGVQPGDKDIPIEVYKELGITPQFSKGEYSSAGVRQGPKAPPPQAKATSTGNGYFSLPIEVAAGESMKSSSMYGNRVPFRCNNGNMSSKDHKGIDLTGSTGTPLLATQNNGKVVFAGKESGYGNSVKVEYTLNNGNRLVCHYAHMSSIDVKVGDSVNAGQKLGGLGATGNVTGPHLHFETYIVPSGKEDNTKNRVYINPNDYLAEIELRGGINVPLIYNGTQPQYTSVKGKDALAGTKELLAAQGVTAATAEGDLALDNAKVKKQLTEAEQSNPYAWITQLFGGGMGEDGGGLFDSLFSMLLPMLLMSITAEGKSAKEAEVQAREMKSTGELDITPLTPGIDRCVITSSPDGASMHIDSAGKSYSHKLSPAEENHLIEVLNNPDIDDNQRQILVSKLANNIFAQQSTAYNFSMSTENQQNNQTLTR